MIEKKKKKSYDRNTPANGYSRYKTKFKITADNFHE